ncbi:hypothetical protein HYPSUDRAFT_48332 [Hypholoma sublateritium FD-334 SS-4]|uniref:Wax synthase domain-containing protein n=1 Tax=Hypholoma sublateritium (strain FD-334 SS-4) TaxID=945553 RepID=A0A0D2NFM6_HYPSF|nr:hypothetical protein HYPSUDRAFT_48332 [Hypholoma sublateritium FD-334 SS-4]
MKYALNPNLLGIIHILLIIALALGSKTTRFNEFFFIPIALLCTHMVFFSVSESRTSDYLLSLSVLITLFSASDFILLRRHQPELRKIGQQKPTSEMSFPGRLWWAGSLDIAIRGVGWAHEPTNYIAPRPKGTRAQFIASQFLWIAMYFIQFDILSILVRANPCFGTGGPSFGAFGWPWRTTVWIYPITTWVSISISYAMVSILGVAVGLSEPGDWPHLFGSPWKAYTVRNCWGRVWHQMLRKLLTGHMNFLTQILRLPGGTFKTYFKLFGSFAISGLIHYGGDYMLFQNWSGKSMRFFVLQAVAITFEDIVVALAARLGFATQQNAVFKFIGFIWVFAWFTYSLPIWLDPIVHAGTMDDGVNVSLILGLWQGNWVPKRL